MSRKSLRILAIFAALAFSAGCGVSAPAQVPSRPPARVSQPPPVPPHIDFLQSIPSDRVLFEEHGFSLDASDRAILEVQAAWLQRNPQVRITIEGHSHERGTREYALALADRRATAAASFLQSRGISPARISVVSWGKERPAALASEDSAWAQNRRAVTVIRQ